MKTLEQVLLETYWDRHDPIILSLYEASHPLVKRMVEEGTLAFTHATPDFSNHKLVIHVRATELGETRLRQLQEGTA